MGFGASSFLGGFGIIDGGFAGSTGGSGEPIPIIIRLLNWGNGEEDTLAYVDGTDTIIVWR